MIGVDYDSAALHTAAQRTLPVLRLVCADAEYVPLPVACTDLILIRHPDVHRAPEGWARALRNAPRLLRDGGVLMVTTYTQPELAQVRHWLEGVPLVLLPLSSLVAVGLQGRDRHIFAATLSGARV